MEDGRCFTVWPSYLDAVENLSDEQRLDVYDAMFIFGIDGVEPDFLTDPASKAIFALLRPTIEKSVKEHAAGRTGAKKSAEAKARKAAKKAPCKGGSEGG